MRPRHRLRAARVRVTRNDGVRILARDLEQSLQKPIEQTDRKIDLLAQPKTRIERDLIVAAAAGVDLIGERTDPLLQLPNNDRVNILIGGAVEELRRACLFPDLLERRKHTIAFVRGEDADPLQRPRLCERAANVGIQQPLIEVQRS